MYSVMNREIQAGKCKKAPVAIIMLSLNEGHNMEAVLDNIQDWANEVFLVDSYSTDDTIDIALKRGVHVVQRRFQGFGDQWNFALQKLPIKSSWTMKIDPDERLSEELKVNIVEAMLQGNCDGIEFNRRWWLMSRELPIRDRILRVWRTGHCKFTDIVVNEHPIVSGKIKYVTGDMEHHDSPDLDHWLEKQNRYTTAEAINTYKNVPLADVPRLFGTAFQRRMWVKKNFFRIPFRYLLLFFYYWLWLGTWRTGWVGYASARLWSDVLRLREYKLREIEITGHLPVNRLYDPGKPDKRVQQFD